MTHGARCGGDTAASSGAGGDSALFLGEAEGKSAILRDGPSGVGVVPEAAVRAGAPDCALGVSRVRGHRKAGGAAITDCT